MGESIVEATDRRDPKALRQPVRADEEIIEIETDKVNKSSRSCSGQVNFL